MAVIPNSVRITGPVAPTDDADVYPSHDATWGKGGFRTAPDLATTPFLARDNIPADRRHIGMVVYVEDTGVPGPSGPPAMYQLVGGILNGNWQLFTGAGEWADLTTHLAPVDGIAKKVSIGTTTVPTAAGTPATDPGAMFRIEGGHIEIKGTPAGFGGAGEWDGPHFVMGTYHFWVDDDTPGRLRMKNGAPTSATDGDLVGAQS